MGRVWAGKPQDPGINPCCWSLGWKCSTWHLGKTVFTERPVRPSICFSAAWILTEKSSWDAQASFSLIKKTRRCGRPHGAWRVDLLMWRWMEGSGARSCHKSGKSGPDSLIFHPLILSYPSVFARQLTYTDTHQTHMHTHTHTHTHSQLKRPVTDRLILPPSLSRSILTQDLSSSLLLSPMIKTHRRVVGVEKHLKMNMNELTTKKNCTAVILKFLKRSCPFHSCEGKFPQIWHQCLLGLKDELILVIEGQRSL